MAITDEQFLEARYSRREKAFDRAMDRRERRERQAQPLVGQLMKEGVIVFYINVRSMKGFFTGKIKEFTDEWDAVQFLVRNHYV